METLNEINDYSICELPPSHVPEGWFITDYSEMTNGGCDGDVAPDGCSGLAVISRYPFIEVRTYKE